MISKSGLDMEQIKGMAGQAGQGISNWWGSLPEDARSTMLRGALGAGGGALALGLAHRGLSDKEDRGGTLGPALLGALLGGGAAVAAPYGMKIMSGEKKLWPEEPRKPLDAVLNKAVGGVAKHPGMTAGALFGAGYAANKLPTKSNILGKIKPKELDRKDQEVFRSARDVVYPTKWNQPSKHQPFMNTPSLTRRPTQAAQTIFNYLRDVIRRKRSPKGFGWRSGATSFAKGMGRDVYRFARNAPADLSAALSGAGAPQEVRQLRQLAKLRAPGRVLATAAIAPALGWLADRYVFGRNE